MGGGGQHGVHSRPISCSPAHQKGCHGPHGRVEKGRAGGQRHHNNVGLYDMQQAMRGGGGGGEGAGRLLEAGGGSCVAKHRKLPPPKQTKTKTPTRSHTHLEFPSLPRWVRGWLWAAKRPTTDRSSPKASTSQSMQGPLSWVRVRTRAGRASAAADFNVSASNTSALSGMPSARWWPVRYHAHPVAIQQGVTWGGGNKHT